MSDRILLIEADPEARNAQQNLLSEEGYEVSTAGNAHEALREIESSPPDVIVCDVGISGIGEGDLLLQLARSARRSTIIVTSTQDEELATADAIARGAYERIEKPISPSTLLLKLRNAGERGRLRRDNRLLRREIARSVGELPIVAASTPMIALLEQVERVAQRDSTVLLCGEAGTGKEVLARAIHSLSRRRNRSFLTANCAIRPDRRLEAEIFGSPPGSGPGDRAQRGLIHDATRGTLFLDEVAALPLELQSRLLSVLQSEGSKRPSPVDEPSPEVRILAATAKDLEAEVSSGRFLEELYEELNATRLEIPPLRERRKDISLLVDHFLNRYRQLLAKPVRRITDDALERLIAHEWKGNARELDNVVERAVILATGDFITTSELPVQISQPAESGEGPEENLCLKRARRQLEVQLIRRALRATNGNRTHAAKRLEISHRALLYKIKEYRIRD
jgi:two-component system response regulator AtoC